MRRFVVLFALGMAACSTPIESESSPAAVVSETPCARCSDWLADPSYVEHGSLCVASDYFAEEVVACGASLGDCGDIALSRPPNEECMSQLESECYPQITSCEQDIEGL